MEGQPAWQGRAPEAWIAKTEGLDSVSSDSQWDLTSGMLKVNSSALGEQGGERTLGRAVDPRKTAQLGGGTKVLATAISLSHPPAEIPKGTSSVTQVACTSQMPNTVLL